MVRIIRRADPPGDVAPAATLSAPPLATPVEVGLVLRSAREKAGLSLESVRGSTGVPMVDLAALEHGHLEVLHVEQAAVVGLWRYAELLGLDPGPLVGVVRAHWPRPALAVDAMRRDPDSTGMPGALLAEADGLLSAIARRGGDAGRGSVSRRDPDRDPDRHLGLSEATRRELAGGTASHMLALTVLGAASRAPTAALPPVDAAAVPDPPVDAAAVADVDAVVSAGKVRPRWRPGQLLHVVAERFGLDELDDEGPPAGSATWQSPAPSETTTVDVPAGEVASPGDGSPSVPPPISTAHA